MPFESYGELVETIGDWLARDDLDVQIPQFIRLTEIDAQRDLNLREIEQVVTGQLVADEALFPLPVDVLEPRLFIIQTSPPKMPMLVSRGKLEEIRYNAAFNSSFGSGSAAEVFAYCVEGNNLNLAAAPGDTYDYQLTYIGPLAPLSDTNTSNYLLQQAPDIYLYGALCHSSPYLGTDERMQQWVTLYTSARDRFKKQEWKARTGGANELRIRPDYQPNETDTQWRWRK